MSLASQEIVIRLATPADAVCLSALGIQVFLDTYATTGIWPALAREALGNFSVKALEYQLEQPGEIFLVAERGASLVAFARLSQPEHEKPEGAFYMSHLYVQEPFTRKGIGKALLTRAEALARERGGTAIWLTAWSENPRARAFYAGQGYDDVGPTTFTFENETYDNRKFFKRLL